MKPETLQELEETAWEEGYEKGYRVAQVEQDDRNVDTIMGLRDENARLREELGSFKNALMIKVSVIEGQRAAIEALELKLKDAEKLHKADQKHIEELHNAIEPKQQQISQLNNEVIKQRAMIDELRQAILKHVKETMR